MIGNNNKGFSLVEMLVAVAIFIVVITMVLSIFQNSLMVQRNSTASQILQEGVRYALEVMSKETRSAMTIYVDRLDPASEKCDLLDALDPAKRVYNYENDSGIDYFYFRNREGKCVYYYKSGDRLYIQRDNLSLPITPEGIIVNSFIATTDDDSIATTPTKQPNVTFVIDLTSKLDTNSTIKIQTSISSRYYE